MDATDIEKNSEKDGWSRDPSKADEHVLIPGAPGETDFAVISKELAAAANMLPVPVRLTHGRHFGNGSGYGIAHIIYHHAAALARWEFYSAQDFVDHVLQGFDAVYIGEEDRRIVLKRKDSDIAVDRILILELSESGNYYSVVTGWFVSTRRSVRGTLIAERMEKDGVLVWECRAPH